jgi:hypothetical protein
MATCDGCGGSQLASDPFGNFPERGWALPYYNFGYYGGFSDDINYIIGETEPKSWKLCHDCVLAIFSVLPALGRSLGVGQHPCDDDTPCCKWAWKTDNGMTLVVGNDGNWRKLNADDNLS